jgi:uncharacterized membrane protein YecN with MAPEG domain
VLANDAEYLPYFMILYLALFFLSFDGVRLLVYGFLMVGCRYGHTISYLMGSAL